MYSYILSSPVRTAGRQAGRQSSKQASKQTGGQQQQHRQHQSLPPFPTSIQTQRLHAEHEKKKKV